MTVFHLWKWQVKSLNFKQPCPETQTYTCILQAACSNGGCDSLSILVFHFPWPSHHSYQIVPPVTVVSTLSADQYFLHELHLLFSLDPICELSPPVLRLPLPVLPKTSEHRVLPTSASLCWYFNITFLVVLIIDFNILTFYNNVKYIYYILNIWVCSSYLNIIYWQYISSHILFNMWKNRHWIKLCVHISIHNYQIFIRSITLLSWWLHIRLPSFLQEIGQLIKNEVKI